ncbi:hypothetical protein GGX14DRAFT_642808 [Mycena pura]|uniref:DUF6699 domain-containing protein n=1 Tax=Mycena pura TaxID=153505 RepID=A0AAD6YQD6_9AGAR|nr:hypothetical protein GGX14DRAFT_642808 [Mycena pura]
MPGIPKHVRFSDNVVSTPSPAFSLASLPSSYGPLTPPQAAFNAYLPMTGVAAVNPVLTFAGPMAPPHLSFDVTLPAANVRPSKRNMNMDSSILLQPATNPPLPMLILTHPRLRTWKIQITPAEGGGYVRVIDVLEGIYASLRQQATAADYESLPSRDAQRDVTGAFTRRWSLMPDAAGRSLEKAKGLKRVDFLGSTFMFAGLVQSQQGPNYWDLVLL